VAGTGAFLRRGVAGDAASPRRFRATESCSEARWGSHARFAEIELDEILALDQALDRLAVVDERLREIVELRFFGGFSEHEVADLLGVSPRTVERHWIKARLFLLRELEPKTATPRTNGESG
jgi:RNA polymerase sigma factor (sigma-70 family)